MVKMSEKDMVYNKYTNDVRMMEWIALKAKKEFYMFF